MLVHANIQKWGNSLNRQALPFSEADLLKGLTPRKAHADEVVIVTDAIVGNNVSGNDKRV